MNSAINLNGQRIGAKGTRTRTRLIEATVEMLGTHGLRDLTVADVAKAAGTSPATFYVYFSSVAETVLAALAQVDDKPAELVELLQTEWTSDNGLARARDLVDAYVRHWDENRIIFRVRNHAAEEGDPKFVSMRVEAVRPVLNLLRHKIEQLQAIGAVSAMISAASLSGTIVTLLERLSAVLPIMRDSLAITRDGMSSAAAYMIFKTLGIDQAQSPKSGENGE